MAALISVVRKRGNDHTALGDQKTIFRSRKRQPGTGKSGAGKQNLLFVVENLSKRCFDLVSVREVVLLEDEAWKKMDLFRLAQYVQICALCY